MGTVKFIDILLVEDNLGDIRLTQEALKDSKVINKINVVTNGLEAGDFLFQRENYQHAPEPDLIILDLNLPKKGGIELLAEIKEDHRLKKIPVIVLTSSKAEADILKSYNLHANCYISKPIDLEKFIRVVLSIEDFWLSIVTLPKQSDKNSVNENCKYSSD
jgi:two-component system, chemotaxis family, response regulator Rcp1